MFIFQIKDEEMFDYVITSHNITFLFWKRDNLDRSDDA